MYSDFVFACAALKNKYNLKNSVRFVRLGRLINFLSKTACAHTLSERGGSSHAVFKTLSADIKKAKNDATLIFGYVVINIQAYALTKIGFFEV
jgi:hypothetical protein